jgi:PAS domain S-box-containing protein
MTESPQAPSGGAPRILVVEDELIVAADISSRLTRLGYVVAGSTDRGDDAVRLADALRPDLVLMDIRLQGETDGVAAAEAIRSRLRIPVVYLTAHTDEATLQRAKVTEPFGYVLKPFYERELKTVLEMARYKHAAERRLAESARRYATTLASIGDAVVATDPTGRITFLNPAAERLTGWPLAEAGGRPLVEVFRVVAEHTREPIENPATRVLQTGTVVGLANSTVLVARDGREYPIDDCAAPIHDDDGATSGVVLVFRDVTEDRRREDELRQAQKMEAVGQLAAGIAHDFNNLLTVISGYCALLLDSFGSDSPWRGALAEMSRATDRAADLTRQLLAFGRKQLLQPKVLDLNQVVLDGLALLRRLIRENIELVTDLSPAPLLTKVDRGQLEQVIVNLVLNARDAMPDGGRLRLATGLLAGRARLVVADTGCGMDPRTRARIWEPFFTTKEVGKGTGLGLASVYGIVKQSGGDIEVQSELGRGSTFTITLPLTAEAAPGPAPGALPELPRGTETVLLVEDDDAVRALAAKLLRTVGYTVLEARHGVEALDVVGRHSGPIHLLVTDLVMPQMSGRALADVIRSARPDLPVLFITGYNEDALLRPGDPRAERNVLPKPFSPKALAAMVREILDRARAASP